MHTVIIGAGEVGLNTARMLSHEGHNVVLVERDEKLVEKAAEELDALVIAGNGANPKLLDEAGIRSSDLLIAASNSDEVNIIACLAAKAQGVSSTVARIHNSDYFEAGEPFASEMLGIDFIIHTEQMAAQEIKEALLVPGAINVDSFAEDTIEVAEVILNEGSEAVGRALRDVSLPDDSLIVGVVQGRRGARAKGCDDAGEEGPRTLDQRPPADLRSRWRAGNGHGAGKGGNHLRRRAHRSAAGPLARKSRHVGEGH